MNAISDAKKTKKILLVYPPFSDAQGPYISIPVLSAYLKDKNIPVSGIDLNSEFLFRFINRQRILEGKNYARERFQELNDSPGLSFTDSYEYWELFNILTEIEAKQDEISFLSFPFFDFEYLQKSPDRFLLTQLAFLPGSMDTILPKQRWRAATLLDEFKSADIIKSCRERNCFSHLIEEILTDAIKEQDPGIVGFSIVFQPQVFPAFQCASAIKKLFPAIHVTIGGPFVSTHFRKIREKGLFDFIDSLVLDEGEIPLEQLSHQLSRCSPNLYHVPGLVFLDGDNIRVNKPAPMLDMEKSSAPDYSVFRLERYLRKRSMVNVPFRLSKGCKWQKCSFCRTNIPFCKNYQQPAFSRVYDQLVEVAEENQIKDFQFSDESFSPAALEYISRRLIAEKRNIRWFCHTRVSKELDGKKCMLFKKAGCHALAIGIESLSERVLRLMKKGITPRLVDQVLRSINGAIPITAYMILGFPTETEEEILYNYKTLQNYVKRGLLKNVDFNIFILFYGSEIWSNPEKYGISDLYQLPDQDLFPNICRFKGNGVSRRKAFYYYTSFSQNIKTNIANGAEEITIDGRRVKTNYSMNTIRQNHIENWHVLYLPFKQWLREGDRYFPVLKPRI